MAACHRQDLCKIVPRAAQISSAGQGLDHTDLANQEFAFRGNNESTTLFNRGNYVELIYAFAENDERISRHLETSTVFSGLSN